MNNSKTLPKVQALYEDLVKNLLRIYPFKDLEIIVGHYLIEKAKQNDMAQEEDDMSADFKINPQQIKESLRKLEKYRIIESFELKIKKPQENQDNTRRKYYTFWRISNAIVRDTEQILDFMEKQIFSQYKKNKTKSFFVCQNESCREKYSLERAFMLQNRCAKIECQAQLLHQLQDKEELQKQHDEENKSKQIISQIRNIIILIGNNQFPFEQNLQQYENTADASRNHPAQQSQSLEQQIKKNTAENESQKLKFLKQLFQQEIDLSIESLLKLNLNYQTFQYLKSKITSS